MKYLHWYIEGFKSYWKQLSVAILCHVANTVCALSYIYLSKLLVDLATGHARAFSGKDTKTSIIIGGAVLIGVIIFREVLRGVKNYLQTKASVKLNVQLRKRLFERILNTKGDVRSKYHTGDVLSRIGEDVGSVSNVCCNNIPNILGTALQFTAAFLYMMYLDARLAWTMVIILPTGFLCGKFILRRIRLLTLEVRKNESQVQSHIQESIQHQTLLQSMENVPMSCDRLGVLQEILFGNYMKRTRFTLLSRIVVFLSMAIAYAIAFLWGVLGIFQGTITYGIMTAFLQLVGQLQRPLFEMGEYLPAVFHSTASIDRLVEFEELPKEEAFEKNLLSGSCGISLESVWFRYDDGHRFVLAGMSHDFKPGSRTAIIGETGSGKSTTIKLMLSLLTAQDGEIKIYNSRQSLTASPATRCNLAYVPQGNSLFSGTIRDNLLIGKPDATEEDLKKAIYTAAAEFVYELKEGLDTECFEAGGGLSEGQAQRIAVARGLLRPGSILLFDEFSSALDPMTEKTMIERLVEGYSEKTMIFITHREKIAQFCNDVLKIEKSTTSKK